MVEAEGKGELHILGAGLNAAPAEDAFVVVAHVERVVDFDFAMLSAGGVLAKATGIGMVLLGDDELALKVGYQSSPQGGAGAGGTLGVSYGLRFGR